MKSSIRKMQTAAGGPMKKIKTRDINGNWVYMDVSTGRTTSAGPETGTIRTNTVKSVGGDVKTKQGRVKIAQKQATSYNNRQHKVHNYSDTTRRLKQKYQDVVLDEQGEPKIVQTDYTPALEAPMQIVSPEFDVLTLGRQAVTSMYKAAKPATDVSSEIYYHGSPTQGLTTLEPQNGLLWLTDSKSGATLYGGGITGRGSLYKINNIDLGDNILTVNGKFHSPFKVPLKDLPEDVLKYLPKDKHAYIDRIADAARQAGYSSVQFKNVLDFGGKGASINPFHSYMYKQTAIFNPVNITSESVSPISRLLKFKQGGKMNTIQFLQGGNKIRKGEDGLKNFLGNSTVNSPETRNVSDHNLGRLYDELSKSKIPMNHTTREQFITRSKDVINAINKHFSGPEIPRVFRNALLTVALEETGLNPSNQYLYGIIGGLRNLYQQKFGGRKDSDSITHFIKKYFKGEYKNLGYSPKAIPSNVTDPREILTYYMTNLGDPSFFKRKNKGNTVAWKKWNEWLPIILNSNLIAQNDSNFENNKNQFNTFNNEPENNLNNVFNKPENDSYNIIDPNDQLKKLNKQSGNVMLSKNGNKLIALIPKGKTGIHIKKKNRGKFTDYCGGKVTDSCIRRAKASGNPTLVKRATFADNARHFKHRLGGQIVQEFKLRKMLNKLIM